MKEFPSTCITIRVRRRDEKQNLEEITFFIDWNGIYGMLKIPIILIAMEIILKLTFRVVKFNNVFTIYIDITIYLYD